MVSTPVLASNMELHKHNNDTIVFNDGIGDPVCINELDHLECTDETCIAYYSDFFNSSIEIVFIGFSDEPFVNIPSDLDNHIEYLKSIGYDIKIGMVTQAAQESCNHLYDFMYSSIRTTHEFPNGGGICLRVHKYDVAIYVCRWCSHVREVWDYISYGPGCGSYHS